MWREFNSKSTCSPKVCKRALSVGMHTKRTLSVGMHTKRVADAQGANRVIKIKLAFDSVGCCQMSARGFTVSREGDEEEQTCGAAVHTTCRKTRAPPQADAAPPFTKGLPR